MGSIEAPKLGLINVLFEVGLGVVEWYLMRSHLVKSEDILCRSGSNILFQLSACRTRI